MKKTHLLPSLLLILLASCQMPGLRLEEIEIASTTLEELLKGQGLKQGKVKRQMGKSKEELLLHAAEQGWVSVVHKLLLQGVKVDNTDSMSRRPLHLAAFRGHTEVAALLLFHGADLAIKNTFGRTVLQLAQLSKYGTETAAFLELARGKSKTWLEGYYRGFAYKKKHEKDDKKVHAYAKAYADLYEEKIASGDSPEDAKKAAEAVA